jgi:hypothetical protein
VTNATREETRRYKVAVVDDAFDSPTDFFDPARLSAFLDEIEADETLAAERNEAELELFSVSDITSTLVDTVLRKDTLTPGIAKMLRLTFAGEIAEREQVLDLTRELEQSGAVVERYSTAAVRRGEAPASDLDLVFLDFFLGDPANPESRELSLEVARRIVNASTADRLPLIVLMSSRLEGPSISRDERINAFKGESTVPGPAFVFTSKADLIGNWQAELYCSVARETHSVRVALRWLAERFPEAIRAAATQVAAVLSELELADYAYLQRLRLESDGHPFGDYVAWLMASRVSAIVLERELREEVRRVNGVRFDLMIPSHMPPSNRVAEMYEAAVFEQDRGPLASHPRATHSEYPMILLGDLFESTSAKKVVVVASADCDLATSPDTKQRQIPSSQSVMLVPGTLIPIGDAAGESATRTDIYTSSGTQYSIKWDLSQWTSVPLGGFLNWLEANGFDTSNYRRFRPLFALHIQQALHHRLSRIGLPKSPPLFRSLRGKAVWVTDESSIDLFAIEQGDFVLTRAYDGKKENLHLNIGVAARLQRAIQESVESDLSHLEEGQETRDLSSMRERNSDIEKWIKLVNSPDGVPWTPGQPMEKVHGLPLSLVNCVAALELPAGRKLKGAVVLLQDVALTPDNISLNAEIPRQGVLGPES